MISKTDAREARRVGVKAVKLAVSGIHEGSVAIRRKPGPDYKISYKRVDLKQVARDTKHMPDEFIGPHANDVTPAFIDYLRPIVGPLPRIGRLNKTHA